MIHTDLSKILIVDTETTGLGNTDEILQLSIIDGLGVYRQLIGHPATAARAVALNLPPTDVRAVQKGTLIPKSSPAVTLVTPL